MKRENLFIAMDFERELKELRKEAEKNEKALRRANFEFEVLKRKIRMYEMAIEELKNEEEEEED